MSMMLVPRHYLTPDQLRAVELSPEQHRVVSGGPGSGKTQVLLHRAKHLSDTYGMPAERYHIFVYTRLLKDYIRSASEMLQIPEDTIGTLDSWCKAAYSDWIGGKLPQKTGGGIDWDKVRAGVCRYLEGKSPCFDFVLVDEGQDLDASVYRLLRAAAKHVTVCMDLKQQIYDFDVTLKDVLRALGVRQQNAVLLGHYRNCPYIVELAASFLDDIEERRIHLAQAHRPEGERAIPVLYIADSRTQERDNLAKVIRTRMAQGERIGILFPRRNQVFGYAKGLKEYGISTEVCANEPVDFSNNLPKVMTYHSAKGLTFDSVMMPRLVPSSFQGPQKEKISKLLFVGASRAIKWVYLSTVTGQEISILDRLEPLKLKGSLVIRTAEDDVQSAGNEDEDDSGVWPF